MNKSNKAEIIMQADTRLLEEMYMSSALRDRRIYFNEEVTRESVCKAIHMIERLVSIDKKKGTKEDIEIVINSEGGSCCAGLSLVSLILSLQEQGYNINTISHSLSASMGFIFLIVGSYRRAFRYSQILCHQPSSFEWGTLQDLEDGTEETKKIWEIMKNIIIEHTKITEEQLDDMKVHKRDWWMTSKEALSLGVIDEIV